MKCGNRYHESTLIIVVVKEEEEEENANQSVWEGEERFIDNERGVNEVVVSRYR